MRQIIQNPNIINDLIRQLHNDNYGLMSSYIDCCTTLHIMDPNSKQKHMYRADTYFYKRPWNDWCESVWTTDNSSGKFPCRILLFVDTSNMIFRSYKSKFDKYIAVVRASEKDERSQVKKKNKDCILIDSFESDKYIRMINCNTITKPIFVIPDVNEVKRIENKYQFDSSHRIMLKDRNTWSKMFFETSWN